MTDGADASLRMTARVAGLAYLFVVVGYVLLWTLVIGRLVVPGDVAATVNNVQGHEVLFRVGFACDLAIMVSLIALAVTHYVLLKTVSAGLAVFALCLRLAEAVLATVTMFIGAIALPILQEPGFAHAFEPEELSALVGFVLNLRNAAWTVPAVFTCLGSLVFLYLFFASRYVPRLLSGFGMFSYAILLAHTFIKAPAIRISSAELMVGAPSVVFEVVMGLWLIVKGVDLHRRVVATAAPEIASAAS